MENDDLAMAPRQAGLVGGCGGADSRLFYARNESELVARAAVRFHVKPVFGPAARPWLRFDQRRVLLALGLALGLVAVLQQFGLLLLVGFILVAVVAFTVAFLEIVERPYRIWLLYRFGSSAEFVGDPVRRRG